MFQDNNKSYGQRAGLMAAAVLLLASPSLDSARAQTPAAKPPASAAPAAAAPQRTETIVYDNWVLTCRDTLGKSDKKTCAAALQISDNGTKRVIFVWQFGQDNAGRSVFVLRTPLGIRIKEGVKLSIGEAKARKVDFVSCDTNGCEAVGTFDEGLAKELVSAPAAKVTFTATSGQGINLNVPLAGIEKALPNLRR